MSRGITVDDLAPSSFQPDTEASAAAPGTVPGAGTRTGPRGLTVDDVAGTNLFGYQPGAAAKPKPGEDATWYDWTRYAKSGVGGLISSIGAASEYLNRPLFGGDDTTPVPTDTMAARTKEYGREVSEAAEAEMSPAARQRITKDLFESDDFFGSLAAKGISGIVSSLPSLAAAGVAAVGSGGLALVLAGSVAALQNAGGTYDDLQQAVDALPKEQLYANSAYYKKLIDAGMDEKSAKAKLAQEFAGMGPAVAGLITALTTKLGVEGAIASRFATGMVVKNILGKGLIAGAAGEGVQESIESFSQALAVQQSLVDAGTQKEIDWSAVRKQTIEGGIVGAAMGGPANVVLGIGEHTQTPPGSPAAPPAGTPATPTQPVNPAPPGGAGQAQTAAPAGPAAGPTGVPPQPAGGLGNAPVAPPPAANPPGTAAAQSGAPTPGKQPAPAGGAAAAPGPTVTVVPPGTIDPSLAAANAAPEAVEEAEEIQAGRGRYDPSLNAVFAADYVAPPPDVAPPAPPPMAEPGPSPGAAVNQPEPPPIRRPGQESPVVDARTSTIQPGAAGAFPDPPTASPVPPAEPPPAPVAPSSAINPPPAGPSVPPAEPTPAPATEDRGGVETPPLQEPPPAAAAPFRPTGEWQPAPRDYVFQPGMEFRFDTQTGQQFVRDPKAVPPQDVGGPPTAPAGVEETLTGLARQIMNGLAQVSKGKRFPDASLRERAAYEAAQHLVATGRQESAEEALQAASFAYDSYAGQPSKGASARATSKARGKPVQGEPASTLPPAPGLPRRERTTPAPAVARPDVEVTSQGPPSKGTKKKPVKKSAKVEAEPQAAPAAPGTAPEVNIPITPKAAGPKLSPGRRARAARVERLLDAVRTEERDEDGDVSYVAGFPDAAMRRQAAERAASEIESTDSDRTLFDLARRYYAELETAAEQPAPEVRAEREVEALVEHEAEVRAEKDVTPKKRSRATKNKPRDVEDVAVESERTAIDQARALVADQGDKAPEWAHLYVEAGEVSKPKNKKPGWKARRSLLISQAREGKLAEAQAKVAPKPTKEERVAKRTEEVSLTPEELTKRRLAEERAAKMAQPEVAKLEHDAENVFKAAPMPAITGDIGAARKSILLWAGKLKKSVLARAPITLRADRGPYTRFLALAKRALSSNATQANVDDLMAGYTYLSASTQEFDAIFSKADDASDMKAVTTEYQQENITSADLSETQKLSKRTRRSEMPGRNRAKHAQAKNVRPVGEDTLTNWSTKLSVKVAKEDRQTVASLLDKHAPPKSNNPVIRKVQEWVDAFIRQHYGDVQVYFVSNTEMETLLAREADDIPVGLPPVNGIWSPPTRSAAADGHPGIIILNKGILRADYWIRWGKDKGFPGHIIRHEMMHLVTGMALADPTLPFGNTVRSILRESRAHFAKRFGEERASEVNGFKDEYEFLADGLSEDTFQEILDDTPISADLRQEVLATTGARTQWWRFIDAIVDLFGMRRRKDVMVAFDALVRTGQHLMMNPAQQQARSLNWDPTVAKPWSPGIVMPQSMIDDVETLAADLGVHPTKAWSLLRPTQLSEHLDRADYTGGSPKEAIADFLMSNIRKSQLRGGLRAEKINSPLKWFKRWLSVNTLWDIARISRETGLMRTDASGQSLIDHITVAAGKLDQAHIDLKQEGHALVNDLRQFNAKLANAGLLDQFNNLVFDSTRFGLTATGGLASNPHIDPNDPAFGQRWAQLARLSQIYAGMSGEEQTMYDRLRKYFVDAQTGYTDDLLNSQLEDWETRGRGAPRAYPPGETRASAIAWAKSGDINRTGRARTARDIALHTALGSFAKQLQAAVNVSKIEGFYFPLLRDDGEFILYGRAHVEVPPGATLLPESVPRERQNRNLFYFKDPADADAYLASLGLEDDMPATKHTWYRDATGQSVPKGTPGAQAYTIVEVNNQYFESFQTKQLADDALAELKASGQFGGNGRISNVNLKEAVFNGHSELMPRQLNTLLNSIEQMQGISPTLKAAHKNALVQAAAKSLRGVKVQHRRLPRKNVAGFSMNTEDGVERYTVSMANSRATLRHGGEIDRHLRDAVREVKDREYEGDPNDNLRRQALLEVVQRKVANAEYEQEQSNATRWLMRYGVLKFLGTPHYMITNMTQLLMGWNEVAGRTGAGHGESLKELTTALKDMRAIGLLLRGAKGYVNLPGALARNRRPSQFLDYVRQGLSKKADAANLLDMIDDFAATGVINSDVQITENRLTTRRPPPPGLFRGVKVAGARAFDFAEHLIKQGPAAVELMNRIAPAVAAYRLSRKHGKSHEQAKVIARDALTKSQFDYRAFNMPGVFASEAFHWKAITLFKKFPLNTGIYIGNYLIDSFKGQRGGTTVGRVRAIKLLMGLFAMTWLMAGAEGALPWEPIQAIMYGISKAAKLAGYDTGYTSWDDFTFEMTQTWGKMFMHGPLRELFNIDISGSVGLDTMFSFDRAKEETEEAWWAYIGRFYTGPLGAAGFDLAKGFGHLSKAYLNDDGSEFLKGIEKLLPIKWGQQMARAARLSQYGERSEGRQYTKPEDYTTKDTVLRAALGLKPATESEEQKVSFYQRRQDKEVRGNRTELMGAVARAIKERNEAARVKAMSRIRDWNRAHPKDQIDASDIRQSMKARTRTDRERKREVEKLKETLQ